MSGCCIHTDSKAFFSNLCKEQGIAMSNVGNTNSSMNAFQYGTNNEPLYLYNQLISESLIANFTNDSNWINS